MKDLSVKKSAPIKKNGRKYGHVPTRKAVFSAIMSAAVFLSLAIPAAAFADRLAQGRMGTLLSFVGWYGLTFAACFGFNAAKKVLTGETAFSFPFCLVYGLLSVILMSGTDGDPRMLLTACLIHPVYVYLLSMRSVEKTFRRKTRAAKNKKMIICAEP